MALPACPRPEFREILRKFFTDWSVRNAISLVRVDTSPADFEGKAAALACVNRSIRVDSQTPEAEFAITWWVNHVKH